MFSILELTREGKEKLKHMTIEEKIKYYESMRAYSYRVRVWRILFKTIRYRRKCEYVRRVNAWINRLKCGFLYHGTTEKRLNSILEHGLKPNNQIPKDFINYPDLSRDKSVYLTSDMSTALLFARNNRIEKYINGEYITEKMVLLCISKSVIPKKKLLKDENLSFSIDCFRIEDTIINDFFPLILNEDIKLLNAYA